MPAILVICLSAKCRNLKLMVFLDNDDHAELPPNRNRALENLLDFLGPGRCCQVIVLRFPPEQVIPHAPAHPKSRKSRRLQPADNRCGHIAQGFRTRWPLRFTSWDFAHVNA